MPFDTVLLGWAFDNFLTEQFPVNVDSVVNFVMQCFDGKIWLLFPAVIRKPVPRTSCLKDCTAEYYYCHFISTACTLVKHLVTDEEKLLKGNKQLRMYH